MQALAKTAIQDPSTEQESEYNLLVFEFNREKRNYNKGKKGYFTVLFKSQEKFETLAEQFRSMGFYKNAPIFAKECEYMLQKIKKQRRINEQRLKK